MSTEVPSWAEFQAMKDRLRSLEEFVHSLGARISELEGPR